jgi:hypothetical protein
LSRIFKASAFVTLAAWAWRGKWEKDWNNAASLPLGQTSHFPVIDDKVTLVSIWQSRYSVSFSTRILNVQSCMVSILSQVTLSMFWQIKESFSKPNSLQISDTLVSDLRCFNVLPKNIVRMKKLITCKRPARFIKGFKLWRW